MALRARYPVSADSPGWPISKIAARIAPIVPRHAARSIACWHAQRALSVATDVAPVFDPSDYDTRELRSLADLEGSDAETSVSLPRVDGSEYRPATPDEPSHEQCEMLVAVGGVDPEALGERPYLPVFPDVPAGRRIGRDWIVYLVRTAGEAETRDALARYRARGWLGEDAAATLDARVGDAVRALAPGDGSLDRADHLLSFAHVIRLLGVGDD